MRDDRCVLRYRIVLRRVARALALALVGVVALASNACGGTTDAIVVRSAVPAQAPATPSSAPPAPSAPVAAVAPAPAAPAPAAVAPAPTPARTPTPTAPAAASAVKAPTTGRWIEVDVTRFVVRLMEGERVVREIGPVGVGRQIDTGVYESTQTGLFKVHNKIADRTFDAPYNTYIEWWVGFDIEKANGFHSLLQDKNGKITDASTGRVSNGCIRVGEAEAVFKYAEVGMPVLVHA